MFLPFYRILYALPFVGPLAMAQSMETVIQQGHELAVLEKRGYNPQRTDVARQLRENRLPATTVADYRHLLRQLGARVGKGE